MRQSYHKLGCMTHSLSSVGPYETWLLISWSARGMAHYQVCITSDMTHHPVTIWDMALHWAGHMIHCSLSDGSKDAWFIIMLVVGDMAHYLVITRTWFTFRWVTRDIVHPHVGCIRLGLWSGWTNEAWQHQTCSIGRWSEWNKAYNQVTTWIMVHHQAGNMRYGSSPGRLHEVWLITRQVTWGMAHHQSGSHEIWIIIRRVIWSMAHHQTGGARGVVVIVVGNGHGHTSSNPGRDWLHFT